MFSANHRLVIAINGASAVGKSAVSLEIARIISAPIRQCGEELKQYAQQLGKSVVECTSSENETIDLATRDFVGRIDTVVVVEGRYLECVLYGIEGVTLIELTASLDERAERVMKRDF